jgi:hypothetical protein
MNHTASPELQCRQGIHKLITSVHSKSYRPSGMLIHRQNSHAPLSQQHTDRREMQNRGTGHESKKSSLYVVDAT